MVKSPAQSKQYTEKLIKLLSSNQLCDHCIGRLCTRRKNDETFQQAGKLFRKKTTELAEIHVDDCQLCMGLLKELSDFYQLVKKKIEEYEFESFLIGSKVDEDILEKEKQFIDHFTLHNTASIKQQINEYVGVRLEEEFKKTIDFKHQDIMIIINTQFNVVSLQIKPLYIYGRYNKYKRGIPQTKWFCRQCHGKGCRYCNYTGKLYNDSVEEFIAQPILRVAQAEDEAFHGAGREDIDVCMLGKGRPFVLEVKNPKKRRLNFNQLTQQISNESNEDIAVNSLKYTNKADISRIKAGCFQKVYEIKIHADDTIQKEKLKKVALSLRGTTINQQTPTRVAKRRAEKVRQRQVYDCHVLQVDGAMATLEIESESGTYIKELITGDHGRTQPNISDLLGYACRVDTLDVKKVKGE